MPAQPEVQTEPKERQPTAREVQLEEMAKAGHERMLAALEQNATDNPTPEALEPVAEVIAPEPKAEDQVTKQMRKVKVDGAEIEVSDDDLVASYQKQAAATKRLQDANQQAERIIADATARAATIVPAKPVEPEAKQDFVAKRKEYHQALFEGNQEEADRLFDELMQGRQQQPIPDVDQIIAQATPRIKQELSNESALNRFQVDYKDILDDPYLVSVTQTELRKQEAEGKPYAEALFAAGESTRDWLKSKASSLAPATPTTTTRAEKLDKKGEIDTIPTAHSKASPQGESEQSNSAIILEMRKARGLAV